MQVRKQSWMMWSMFHLDPMETSILNASSCGGVLRSVRYVIFKQKTFTHVSTFLVVEQR